MSGNTFGKLFKVTTFGESHGPALGVVLDGVPPSIPITENDIQKELNRRKPGQSKITTARKEGDKIKILSGVFEGKTTGMPLAMMISNKGQWSRDYSKIRNILRPGHADYTYLAKYGIRDHRGGGRSSGRETAARVAAGAVAKLILAKKKIKVIAYTLSIDDIFVNKIDLSVIEKNIVRAPDLKVAQKMIAHIAKIKKDGNSVGGIVEAVVKGCPAGLGDPVFDKLNARLAHAVMSIGAVCGFEVGDGFASTLFKGSENNDLFCVKGNKIGTVTNHGGGIAGGISNGEDIRLRVAVKPPSSISSPQKTITLSKKPTTVRVKGRHDPCVCPRVVPVVESMIAITLVDSLLIQKSIQS